MGFKEKREEKINRYKELAKNAREKSDDYMGTSHKATEHIPFGQPILIGHHSEKRHRRDLDKSWKAMENAAKEQKKAEYWENKAAGAERNKAIFSDDPEAIEKMTEKIKGLEELQIKMKAANKIIKSKKLSIQEKIDKLKEMGISKTKLLVPDFCGRIGYPSYLLQNNNANIRRCKERLKELQSRAEIDTETEEIQFNNGEITVIKDVEENRVKIVFPGKPDQSVIESLKSFSFRWSRYNMSWQRHLNHQGIEAANDVVIEILELKEDTSILEWQE